MPALFRRPVGQGLFEGAAEEDEDGGGEEADEVDDGDGRGGVDGEGRLLTQLDAEGHHAEGEETGTEEEKKTMHLKFQEYDEYHTLGVHFEFHYRLGQAYV